MPLAVVRSWVEQAVFSMGQTSTRCMVCLRPQSQVSVSIEYPHFDMFTLDRPTCVRNRLSVVLVVQGFSAPAGRCSSALMLRCTLVPRGSSRSLHNSMRAAFAVVLMGSVHLIKLFHFTQIIITSNFQQCIHKRNTHGLLLQNISTGIYRAIFGRFSNNFFSRVTQIL